MKTREVLSVPLASSETKPNPGRLSATSGLMHRGKVGQGSTARGMATITR
jgi:hypothetical protein